MPKPLSKGVILTDLTKKTWKIGSSIGKGRFGEVYSAFAEQDSTTKPAKYVIKVVPHKKGPRLVEGNFYMRNAKEETIQQFCKDRKLNFLGMPVYVASGQEKVNGTKYRFLVMEKYGDNISKLFLENNGQFPTVTVFQLGILILDVLEYIHSKNYVHADIKGSNILLSSTSQSQVYLVDFGLACPYTTSKVFRPNRKKAHYGTIVYLSRDAHNGVPTRRGDLEILVYNLVHWLGCPLPWENNLKDKAAVQQSKETHMAEVQTFLKACFGDQSPPEALVQFIKIVSAMEFNSEPDYKKLRQILVTGLTAAGGKLSLDLIFKSQVQGIRKKVNVSPVPQKKKALAKKAETYQDGDGEIEEQKVENIKKAPRKGVAKKDAPIDGMSNPKPSTSRTAKARSKSEDPAPVFHQEIVNDFHAGDSSDDNEQPVVTTRKPRTNARYVESKPSTRQTAKARSKSEDPAPVFHQEIVNDFHAGDSSDDNEQPVVTTRKPRTNARYVEPKPSTRQTAKARSKSEDPAPVFHQEIVNDFHAGDSSDDNEQPVVTTRKPRTNARYVEPKPSTRQTAKARSKSEDPAPVFHQEIVNDFHAGDSSDDNEQPVVTTRKPRTNARYVEPKPSTRQTAKARSKSEDPAPVFHQEIVNDFHAGDSSDDNEQPVVTTRKPRTSARYNLRSRNVFIPK